MDIIYYLKFLLTFQISSSLNMVITPIVLKHLESTTFKAFNTELLSKSISAEENVNIILGSSKYF